MPDWIEEKVEQALSTPLRKLAAVGLAVALLAVGGFVVGRLIHDTAIGSLRQALYGSCHRGNLSKIATNGNNYSQWKLWNSAITLLTYNGGRQQTLNDPRAAQLFTAFIASMKGQLNAEEWTPLSDCVAATNMPATYVPPQPVSFNAGPPPASAFRLGPNE